MQKISKLFRYRIGVLLFLSHLFLCTQLSSQEQKVAAVAPSYIPSSPAFNLLGVNPEVVTRPSDIKEFKVDWRIKNYKSAPDLALEAQPLWWLYYRNKGIAHYKSISNIERVLSTLSVSLATAKIDNINHLGYAFKFNLYKEKDPYLENSLIAERQEEAQIRIAEIDKEIDSLKLIFDQELDHEKSRTLENQIMDRRFTRVEVHQESMDEVKMASQEFIENNWNMDMLDMAFGFVHKYDNGALDSLKMQYAGFGFWMNYSKGIGKNSLLGLTAKINSIGGNRNLILGSSYRFGTAKFNCFVEAIFSRMNNNLKNGFAGEERFDYAYSEDIGRGWYEYDEGDGYSMYTMTYGCDFRLSRNILLNFALRTEYTSSFKFQRLVPVANLVCLMN